MFQTSMQRKRRNFMAVTPDSAWLPGVLWCTAQASLMAVLEQRNAYHCASCWRFGDGVLDPL